MAILCLSEDMQELKKNLGNIIIGYNEEDKPVFARDLKAEGAMAVLLKDAIKPNLVQTLENTPAIIHGGPFANIAHGCNSIIATKMALKLADYTITEAGFGADLGAEKFLDIKCRKAKLKPNVVVIVATIKALKYHGGVAKENLQEKNLSALKKGFKNLERHIFNIKERFGLKPIVAINKYNTDNEEEINYLLKELKKQNVEVSLVEGWEKGGIGAKDIAEKIVNLAEDNIWEHAMTFETNREVNYIYDLEEDIKTKIKKIATKIYNAENVEYTNEALKKIEKIEKDGYGNLPICIAKTQYSLSDDPKNLECNNKYNIHIRDVELRAGAGFIVALAGKIMTMPGLPKEPAAKKIDINEKNEIIGIF